MNGSVRMISSKDHKVLEVLILCSMLGLSSGAHSILHIPEEHVSTSLHGSVILPCTFPFVQSLEDLSVIWEKKENDKKGIIYRILRGNDLEEQQDPRYRGRVELSTKFSQGNLDLILRDVTYKDEGTYYCRAANQITAEDKKVTLSIDSLDADDPTVTLVTINRKRLWKCRGSGVYHNPQIQWITAAGEDLSGYGTISVTDQNNGWKLVESVLDNDVETNLEVICHIMEGRLKISVRGIISDNEEKKESPDLFVIICAVIGTIILIINIIILYQHKNPSPPRPCASIICYLLKKKDSKISKNDKAAMTKKTFFLLL